jgi:hypothetical protein
MTMIKMTRVSHSSSLYRICFPKLTFYHVTVYIRSVVTVRRIGQSYLRAAMAFVHHFYSPSHTILRLTSRYNMIGLTSRRMASFYNADVAGLTVAQDEVR